MIQNNEILMKEIEIEIGLDAANEIKMVLKLNDLIMKS